MANATMIVHTSTFQRFAHNLGTAKNIIAMDVKYINIFPGLP